MSGRSQVFRSGEYPLENTMRSFPILALLTLTTPPAFALDATCEIYLTAAEKSTKQPARHSVSEPGDGTKLEAIIVDEKYFTNIGGQWQLIPGAHLRKGEHRLLAAIRSGEYPMTGCRKLGSQPFAGVARSVIAYTLNIPGIKAEETRAYIGADGLVHGQTSGKTRVQFRYSGVKPPVP